MWLLKNANKSKGITIPATMPAVITKTKIGFDHAKNQIYGAKNVKPSPDRNDVKPLFSRNISFLLNDYVLIKLFVFTLI